MVQEKGLRDQVPAYGTSQERERGAANLSITQNTFKQRIFSASQSQPGLTAVTGTEPRVSASVPGEYSEASSGFVSTRTVRYMCVRTGSSRPIYGPGSIVLQ